MTSSDDESLFDDWTRDYAMLGLHMDRLLSGTVDGWIGPPAWRMAVEDEPEPEPAALLEAASSLLERLPGMGYSDQRREYLLRQTRSLQTTARMVGGEEISFRDEASLFFDITAEREPESTFEAAHRALDEVLPGTGSLADRMKSHRQTMEMSSEQLGLGLPPATDETRRRTTEHLPLPSEEDVEVKLVEDKPWGAYNWYLGNFRSLIEVNTDLPRGIGTLVDYMAHEGYPGHHTERAIREQRQYRDGGHGEYAIFLINAPEAVIAEAIATCARELIFDDYEDLAWLASEVAPRLGIALDVEQAGRVRDAARGLAAVSGNAAFLLHEDGRSPDEVAEYIERWALASPESARKQVQFLQNPPWRTYTFTYYYGHRLLHPLLQGPDRFQVFERICTEPVYPGLLAARSSQPA